MGEVVTDDRPSSQQLIEFVEDTISGIETQNSGSSVDWTHHFNVAQRLLAQLKSDTDELGQLRRIDLAARAYVDAREHGRRGKPEYELLQETLFNGLPLERTAENNNT